MRVAAGSQLPPQQKVGFTESIISAHPEVVGLQTYEYLGSDGLDQRQPFIDGTRRYLDVSYPKLHPETIHRLQVPMERALGTLAFGAQSPQSRALFGAVEYRYSELFLLNTARIMNTAPTEAERAEAASWFQLAQENLYGKPEESIFSALAARSLVPQMAPHADDDRQVKRWRGELADLTGPISETDYQIQTPSQELVTRIGTLVRARFAGLVDHIDPAKTYDVAGMVQSLDVTLERMGAKGMGWEAVIESGSGSLGVSAHKKQVQVGENKAPITGNVLHGKTIHESGVHAQRSMNAEKAGWPSAAYGQEAYLAFEEALAVALQNAYNDTFTLQGEGYYLIGGLAYGLDNHAKRDTRDIYDVMWRNTALRKVHNGTVSPADLAAAQLTAYRQGKRMSRGTGTRRPGIVDLRDLSYWNGQDPVWRILKDVHTQEDLDPLFAGKLNNANPEQQEMAQAIMDTGIAMYDSSRAR